MQNTMTVENKIVNIKGSFGSLNTKELIERHRAFGRQREFPHAEKAIRQELKERNRFDFDEDAAKYLSTLRHESDDE